LASESQNELRELSLKLLNESSTGTLATVSVKQAGFPFASQAPYAVLNGQPLFLFSDLSVHSKNLRSNDKATLLVQSGDGHDMQRGRASFIGTVQRLDDASIEDARQCYLAAHASAAQWISFGDFRFYSLSIIDTYVVAGFGKAGWAN